MLQLSGICASSVWTIGEECSHSTGAVPPRLPSSASSVGTGKRLEGVYPEQLSLADQGDIPYHMTTQ